MRLGEKVQLKNDIERYPHFYLNKGMTGIVVRITKELIAIKMNKKIVGMEEWNNELQFYSQDGNLTKQFKENLEVID